MVKVIEHGVKKVTCPVCKAKLEYSPEDVEVITVTDLFGSENREYIVCPDCNNKVVLTPMIK